MKTASELDDAELGWRSTDPNAPLDALVRRLSQEAEEIFDETGGVDMLWLVEAPDKGQAMIITPMVVPPEKTIEGVAGVRIPLCPFRIISRSAAGRQCAATLLP
jgi:hypothetical protein